MPITGLAFRTVFAWVRKLRSRSAPDINPNFSRRNLDPIYAVRQFERLIDLGVGIKRQEEILHQKIERSARYGQTADFDAQQMYGRFAMRRLNAGPGPHQLFALDQFGNQPVSLNAVRMAHFQKIDQRRRAGLAVPEHQARLAESILDDGGSLHPHPGVQLRRSESKNRSGLCFAALDEIQLLAYAHRYRIGARNRHRTDEQAC